MHCKLQTRHFTPHTLNCKLLTAHCTLHAAHLTQHTFTLHIFDLNTKNWKLQTANCTHNTLSLYHCPLDNAKRTLLSSYCRAHFPIQWVIKWPLRHGCFSCPEEPGYKETNSMVALSMELYKSYVENCWGRARQKIVRNRNTLSVQQKN